MTELLRLAGLVQLALVIASALIVPRALHWRAELALVSPLTRAIFWTYGVYISTINVAFGLVSLAAPQWLLARGSPLATAVCGFIAAYWAGRIVAQFIAYDPAGRPEGRRYALGEVALLAVFLALTGVYGAATLYDLGGLAG